MPYDQIPAPACGTAIASMICGIVSPCLCYFAILGAVPAVICGHVALAQINRYPGSMPGRGMAIAGLILGYLWISLTAIAAVAIALRVSSL